MTARFRSFKIQILSKGDGFQLELADVDGRAMLIMTDVGEPLAPETYAQEAYGIADSFSESEIRQVGEELRRRLVDRRTTRQP